MGRLRIDGPATPRTPKPPRCRSASSLPNLYVRAALAKRKAEALRRADTTAQDVLAAMRRIVKGDIRTLFDKDGNHRPIHELSAEDAALIAGYELIVKNATAGDGKTDEVLKGLLRDQVEVSGDEELITLLQSARDRGKKADDA